MTGLEFLVLKALIGAVATALVGGIAKGLLWAREVKTNHLPHIQQALEAIPVAMDKQTDAIVDELKQQREDIRLVLTKL